jgi:hypothetical protein
MTTSSTWAAAPPNRAEGSDACGVSDKSSAISAIATKQLSPSDGARLTAKLGSMREFSHDKALNREHDQFLSVTVAVYLGGGLLFLLAVPLILRFECPFESLTKLGWVEFFLWLVALLYSAHCAKSGKGVFRLLDQWEQSLLRRKRDLEAFAAHRTVEERDRVFWLSVGR